MALALENGHATTQWMPTTAEERKVVLQELEAILSSYHFRGSKRYPALLEYVVDAALDNRLGDLKERTLGVEVFGRDPGYDTNADPVVRVSAGEVRKRIAQYYHEHGHASRVQIDLPLGSYAPEFLLRAPDAILPIADPERLKFSEKATRSRRSLMRDILFVLAGVLLAGCGIAGYLYLESSSSGEVAMLKLWNPLFKSPRAVLIVLGTTHPSDTQPPPQTTTFAEHLNNPYHHLSVWVALALTHVTTVLEQHRKAYDVKESQETTLEDIRSRPIVLVGALNNNWTLRLTAPLRFHFSVTANGMQNIVDAANPGPTGWTVPSAQPYPSVTTDYALVARFHDPTTECPVIVIAGIGPYGTEAAGEFVQSPQHLAELSAKLPRGWENKNLEVVIKTNVIGAKAGPPVLVTTYTW
ncbi:MAG: hypothetical protein ABR957_10935 [Terracidiphilus sp.]|jgi:hypothetical protein